MAKTMVVASLAVLVLASLPAQAAVVVSFSPTSVTAAQATAGVSVSIFVTGIPPASLPSTGASFYLKFTTAKLQVTNAVWQTGVYDTFFGTGGVTSKADGAQLAAAIFGAGTGNISSATALVSFTLTAVSGQDPTGLTLAFKTEDAANNQIADKNGTAIPVDTWGTFNVTAGPPAPAHNPTLAVTPARQRDSVTPFTINSTWTTGSGDDIQVQMSTTGPTTGFRTDGLNDGVITDKAFTATTATCHWVSGLLAVHQAIWVRIRILHRGNVWHTGDTSEGVPAATNPTVGWTAGQPVTVDNKGPVLQTPATTSEGGTSVFLTFDDLLDPTTSQIAANYTVTKDGGGATFNVTVATKTGNSTVTLTVDAPLTQAGGAAYHANVVSAVNDSVGNPATGLPQSVAILFKPSLSSAEFVKLAAKNRVNAVFSSTTMVAGTVNIAANWHTFIGDASSTTAGPAVTSAILQVDGKTVFLTLASALAMNTQYTIQAPAAATDASAVPLGTGADSKASFTTPFFHSFAIGLFTVGVPVDPPPVLHVLEVLSATKVARYDPTIPGYKVDPTDEVINNTDGMGYFARFDAAATAFVSGPLITGNVTLPAVQVGWNLITNPYMTAAGASTDIHIEWVSSGATFFQYAWWWDNTQYQLVANLPSTPGVHLTASPILNAWTGYFILQAATGNVTIRPVAPGGAAVQPLQLGGKGAVLIQLIARAGDKVDANNVCGVSSAALKVANPPFAAGSVDLAFIDDDGNAQAFDVATGGVARKWNLLVTTDQPNADVTVSAPDLSAVPRDYTVILSDPETGKKTSLRTSEGFTFKAGAQGATKRLVLEIVPRSTVALVTGVSVAQVGAGRMVVTYSLSGPAAVSASVMNIAGRAIRTLADASTQTAGAHTLSWDLANAAGAAVPRGTYLLRLQARTEDGQQVETVRTFTVNR